MIFSAVDGSGGVLILAEACLADESLDASVLERSRKLRVQSLQR